MKNVTLLTASLYALGAGLLYFSLVGGTIHIGTDGVRAHVHSIKYHIKQFDVKWAQDAKPCCEEMRKQYEER